MNFHTAYISVGSNIGNKLKNCQDGIQSLTAGSLKTTLTATSNFYKTEPMDFKDQDWFVNAVIKIDTPLNPFELLDVLKSIQEKAGRKKDVVRYGPRTLDLDIIFYDDLMLDTDQLKIPHPRMHERRFVLQPLCDINPDIVHPVMKQTARDLMATLDEDEGKVVPYLS